MQPEKSLKLCWYRPQRQWVTTPKAHYEQGPWARGIFYQFAQDYDEFESGPGHYPCAIVEDYQSGRVHTPLAKDVCFGETCPMEAGNDPTT